MRTHDALHIAYFSSLFCRMRRSWQLPASGRAFERETETRFRRVRVRRHAGPTTGAHAPCILKEKMCSAHGVFFSRRIEKAEPQRRSLSPTPSRPRIV